MESQETILEWYGDIILKFTQYYKFSFTFTGVAPDGSVILVSEGGNSGDIYRYECNPTSTTTLRQSIEGDGCYAKITDKDSVIWEWSNY